MKKIFIFPVAISVATLFAVYMWGGAVAFFLAAILSVLEVTLSFDNAVINAKVLAKMNPVWQKRFLTWGIIVAVFGTRLVLPLLIVSVALWLSPLLVAILAFSNPEQYAKLLESIRPSISAFGGAFLLMVSLKYFFDEVKEVHWIQVIEKHLVKWGRIEAIEIALTLLVLLGFSFALPDSSFAILSAGIIGVVLFVLIEGVAGSLSIETKNIAGGGFALFLYLNILDSAFSLDGVIGAFAITTKLMVIVAGLGIGAIFVRTMTVYMVRQKTLENLIYLEHGAHWAILGLAASMFAGLIIHIPEVVIGFIGLFFVGFAYFSSLKNRSSK